PEQRPGPLPRGGSDDGTGAGPDDPALDGLLCAAGQQDQGEPRTRDAKDRSTDHCAPPLGAPTPAGAAARAAVYSTECGGANRRATGSGPAPPSGCLIGPGAPLA